MSLISLSCNDCGAPLKVPDSAKFITCSYCGSQLKIQKSGNAIYSEVFDKIKDDVDEMSEDLETLKLQNELERIDREWEMTSGSLMLQNDKGHKSVPTKFSAVAGVVPIIFAVFWMSMAKSMGAPPFMVLFGVVFIIVGVFIIFSTAGKADQYSKAHAEYQKKRNYLLRKINRK